MESMKPSRMIIMGKINAVAERPIDAKREISNQPDNAQGVEQQEKLR